MRTERAGEQAAGKGWSVQAPVQFNDQVANREFGQFAFFVVEQGIVIFLRFGGLGPRRLSRVLVHLPVCSFMKEKDVVRVDRLFCQRDLQRLVVGLEGFVFRCDVSLVVQQQANALRSREAVFQPGEHFFHLGS